MVKVSANHHCNKTAVASQFFNGHKLGWGGELLKFKTEYFLESRQIVIANIKLLDHNEIAVFSEFCHILEPQICLSLLNTVHIFQATARGGSAINERLTRRSCILMAKYFHI